MRKGNFSEEKAKERGGLGGVGEEMTQPHVNNGSSARALATDLLAREEGVDEIMKDAAASAGCANVSAKAILDGQESGSGLPKYQGIVPHSPPQSNGSLSAKAPGTPARSDALLSATVVQNAIEERAVRSRVSDARAGQGKENEENIRENDDAADDGIAKVPNILTSNGVGLVPPSQPARAAGPATAKVPDAPLQQGPDIATPDVQKKAGWPRTRVASMNGTEVLQCARDIEGCLVFSWGCAHNYQLGAQSPCCFSTCCSIATFLSEPTPLLSRPAIPFIHFSSPCLALSLTPFHPYHTSPPDPNFPQNYSTFLWGTACPI